MIRGKTFYKWLVTVAFLVAFVPAAAGAVELKQEWKDNPEALWTQLHDNWDNNVDTYQCNILSWAYRTDWYNEHLQVPAPGESPSTKEDWVYRIYQVKFSKPKNILFSYNYSAHEKNTESSNIIDSAVAYILKYTGGTTFNYGYRGTDVAYIKFPYVTNKEFKKFDIPFTKKAMMKILMIASRNEIYKRPLNELRDPRGYSVDNLIIGLTMDRFDKYFTYDKDVEITVELSPRLGKKDYTLDDKTGWLVQNPEPSSKTPELVKLTMVDSDSERCKGLNKYEAFIDVEKMMFTGLHEYENGKLVGMTQFYNIEVNADLPEKLWNEDFFGKRRIADK